MNKTSAISSGNQKQTPAYALPGSTMKLGSLEVRSCRAWGWGSEACPRAPITVWQQPGRDSWQPPHTKSQEVYVLWASPLLMPTAAPRESWLL